MNYKVGIPQGLLFYDYYPLWKEFFNEIGVEVILSSKTNKKIVDDGISCCIDEACLPVKVFHGHVVDLKDKVDYLFIPKAISVHKQEYNCPKILGLPEMIKNSVSDLPPIIDTKINLRNSNKLYFKSVIQIGSYFTKNIFKIRKAYRNALYKFNDYKELLNSGVIPIESIRMYNKFFENTSSKKGKKIKILLLGHPYNIYDEHLSMNLIDKIRHKNIKVVTTEMISENKINYYCSKLDKRMFWTAGRKIVGAAYSMIEEKNIQGIIYVSSFGCGLDSILVELIQRKSRENRIPFTLLTLDEHTGEAGINTRVEAFIDMMKWRYKYENNISTHG